MPFPTHFDALTPAWLGQTLGQPIDAVSVRGFGDDHGMTGHLARLTLTRGGATQTLIAKTAASDPETRARMHGMGFYEREVAFYTDLASRTPVRTPRCDFAAVEADGGQLLLLEDLSAWRSPNPIGLTVAEASAVLDALADLHAAWWDAPELTQDPWRALRSFLSIEQSGVIFRHAWEPALARLGALSDDVRAVGDWLYERCEALHARLLRDSARTLVHNDVHAGNLFFDDAGKVALIDWQMTTRGDGAVDVAALLGALLDTPLRRTHEETLLRAYHARRATDEPWATFRDAYRAALLLPIARVLTVVGVGAMPEVHLPALREMILPRACRAALDNDAFEALL